MIPNKIIENVNEQLSNLFGDGPQKTQDELKRGANMILQSAFSRLDIVTREEFDTQKAVLMRTREIVTELEKRLVELEQQQKDSN